MDKLTEVKKRIMEEEDYIKLPKFGDSLNRFLDKNPNVIKDSTIARLLKMSVEDVERIYLEAIELIKKEVGEDDEE